MKTDYITQKAYANRLLNDLDVCFSVHEKYDHPAVSWIKSGLQDVTGQPDQSGQQPPIALTSIADGAIAALRELSSIPDRLPINGSLMLGERSRLMGLKRRGTTSPGGACHLLKASDGNIALNLAREDDFDLLPAWIPDEIHSSFVSNSELARIVCQHKSTDLVNRGRELGLPISASSYFKSDNSWFDIVTQSEKLTKDLYNEKPLVVDLSSLWAGPLASHLMSSMGARVVKVESTSRPDGARQGNSQFYDLLNQEKESVSIDFKSPSDIAKLSKLILRADIVIEASRPRALKQLGIDAEKIVRENPGLVWLGITAYGRDDGNENFVGFGDDVAVAAGLSFLATAQGQMQHFVGDAIADPLAGMHGALAAWAHWQRGEGCLLDVSLYNVLTFAIAQDLVQCENFGVSKTVRMCGWQDEYSNQQLEKYPMRTASVPAAKLGAHTTELFKELSIC